MSEPVPDLVGDTDMRRLHPLTPLLKSWFVVVAGIGYLWSQGIGFIENRVLGGMAPGDGGQDLPVPVWGIVFVVVLLGALGYGWLYWRFTRYGILHGVLRVESGVLFRQTRQVSLDRLQAVDIVRPLVARLTGVAELRMEVAGGGSSEAPLAFLSLPDAQRLRAELLARAAGLDAATPEAPERALVRVPTGELALASLLSSTTIVTLLAGIALAVVVATTGNVALLVPILPALAGMVIAAVRQFSTNYHFTVAESPDGLRIRKGLLDTRSQTVPPGRVQAVRLRQPLLWRSAGLVRLDLTVAGYAAANDNESEKTSVLLPAGSRAVADQLLARVLPGVDVAALALVGAPERARRFRPVGWKHLAAGTEGPVFAARQGWVTRDLVLVPHAKPQSMRITQGPLQRRLGLASMGIDTTKGPVTVVALHRDAGEARAMLDREVELERAARTAAGPDRWEQRGRATTAAAAAPSGPDEPAQPVGHGAPHPLDEPAEAAEPRRVDELGHRPEPR